MPRVDLPHDRQVALGTGPVSRHVVLDLPRRPVGAREAERRVQLAIVEQLVPQPIEVRPHRRVTWVRERLDRLPDDRRPRHFDDLRQGRRNLDEAAVAVEDRPGMPGLLPPAATRPHAAEPVDVPELPLPAGIGQRVALPDNRRRVPDAQPPLQVGGLGPAVGVRAHLVEELGEGLGDEPAEREVLGRKRLEAGLDAGGHGRSAFPETTNRRTSCAVRRIPSLSNSAYCRRDGESRPHKRRQPRVTCPGTASGCSGRRCCRHPCRLILRRLRRRRRTRAARSGGSA